MKSIYVASSWRNEHQAFVVEVLRAAGHKVYDFKNPEGRTGFSWSEVDPNWQNWQTGEYRVALDHKVAQAGFNSDFFAMEQASICVLVLPCGRSAHTEAGYMKGQGKPTYVYVPRPVEPELMYKIYDLVTDSLKELTIAINEGVWHLQGYTPRGHKFNNYQLGKCCHVNSPTASEARYVLFNEYESIEKVNFYFEPDPSIWHDELMCAIRYHGLSHDAPNIRWQTFTDDFDNGVPAAHSFQNYYLEF